MRWGDSVLNWARVKFGTEGTSSAILQMWRIAHVKTEGEISKSYLADEQIWLARAEICVSA